MITYTNNLKTKNLFILILLVMSLQIVSFKTFSQTTYYVDGMNGNNSFAGTSPETAWKTIQKACNAATPNSTVLIKEGIYYENVSVNVSGSQDQPITFKNYPDETVILDGTGTSGSTLLSIIDKSYLIFENITFQNLTKNNAVGVFLECTASGTMISISFKHIVIKNIKWTENANSIPGDNDNAQPFIVYGRATTAERAVTDLVIDSCEFYNNITGFSEALSIDGNVDGFYVTNNMVHNNTNIGILAGGNYGECSIPSLDHARNGRIEMNRCYSNVSSYATSGGIYADGAKNVVIHKNISYENGYGIEVGCEEDGTTENITVINNILYRNHDCGIAVGGYTTETTGQVLNSTFRNNTLYQNDTEENGSGGFYITKASGCTFRNNIVYTTSDNTLFSLEDISPQADNSFDYNLYYTPSGDSEDLNVNWQTSSYESFQEYQSSTSQDAHSLFITPNFVNTTLPDPDLSVMAGSHCEDSGDPATVLIDGETDFNGNPRLLNGTIDIGAFERASIRPDNLFSNKATDFLVYPNPTNKSISLSTLHPIYDGEITLFDMQGKPIISQKMTNSKALIDSSSLKDGLYLIKLTHGKGVSVKPVVILNSGNFY